MCRIRHIVNKKLNYIVIMVTNIIFIVTILGISLGITNISLIFGEVQQDTQMSQQNDLTFMTSNLQDSSFDLLNSSNTEELTTQSHGLIKNKDIGVLVYTHGNPMVPHTADTMKTELIEKNLEKMGHPSEIVTHMPYNLDQGLMNLDKENIKYAVFLYTDLFGPMSTVIHNCPGVPIPPKSCMYMGMMTDPASDVSDTTLVFAEPARLIILL